MKAMALERPAPIESHPLQRVDMPDPMPGPGQVRIRVHACGVCRTDLHLAEGELPMRISPLIPGHQVAGVVDRVGGASPLEISEGDRVGVPWFHSACGHCPDCLSGRENLCAFASFTGWDVQGGYAQYLIAPEAFTLRLPDGLEDHLAAPLLCGGIIGYRALRVCGLQTGETLALYGFGSSAHICIQIARFWNCSVMVFSRTAEHAMLARELGASWVGEAREKPPDRPDRAIIFAPAGWLVPQALGILRPGGTLALAGIYMDAIPPLDYERHLYREKTLRSVTAATRADARELLDLAVRIPIRTKVTRFALEDANVALEQLKRGTLSGSAVLDVP